MPKPVFPDRLSHERLLSQRRRHARFQAFLPARCRLRGPDGRLLELQGRSRNLGERGLLLLLQRALPRGIPLVVELATPAGPVARPGLVGWVGPPERTELGGTVIPHGITFGLELERAFVEGVVIRERPREPRASVEIPVDYGAVLSGRSVNLSRGGIFVRTPHPFPVGREVTLHFHLPGTPAAFRVLGRVIWSPPKVGWDYPQGMGIAFVDLPAARGAEIEAVVAQIRRRTGR